MSHSALEALHAANASYRKELEQIDAVSTSAASRCTPRFAQACDVQRVEWCPESGTFPNPVSPKSTLSRLTLASVHPKTKDS